MKQVKKKYSSAYKTPKNSSNKNSSKTLEFPTSLNTGASIFWVNTLGNTTHEDIMGLDLNKDFWGESDHKSHHEPISFTDDEIKDFLNFDDDEDPSLGQA